MKSNRGSISIYMAIVLPTLIIVMVMIILKLSSIQRTQATITTLTQVSDVQMTKYRISLYDDYRLLAYKQNDEIVALFDTFKAENQLPDSASIVVTPHKLSGPNTYREAVVSAAKAEGVDELVSQGINWLDDYLKNKGKGGIGKQMTDAKEKIYDKLDTKKISNNIKKISQNPNTRKLKNLIQMVDKNARNADEEIEKYKTLMESYQKIYDEDAFGPIKTYINEMRDLSEELKEVNEDLDEIEERIDQKRSRKNTLQERYDNRVLGGLDTGDLKERIRSVKEDINELEDEYEEKMEEVKPIAKAFIEVHFGEQPSWLERLENLKSLVKDKWDETVNAVTNSVDENYLSEEIAQLSKSDFASHSPSILEKGLIVEYCLGIFKSNDPGTMRNFDFTGQKGERESLYKSEVEYILSTHRNDSLNSAVVKGQMMALREPVNLFVILSNPRIRRNITAITAAIPPPWQFIANTAIVGTWSAVESYLDVKALSDGKGVKIIKKYEDFHLSLNSLMDDGMDKIEDNLKNGTTPDDKSKDALYYQDYLRLLLYMQDEDQTLTRMMKLTALDLNGNEEMLEQLSTGHHVTLTRDGDVLLELERDYGQ